MGGVISFFLGGGENVGKTNIADVACAATITFFFSSFFFLKWP